MPRTQASLRPVPARGLWIAAALFFGYTSASLAHAAPEDDDEGGDDGFAIVDLTEDEEALKKELEVETKKVKGEAGILKGTVKDGLTGDPIIGAYVEVLGADFQTKTNFDGEYELNLPVGVHEIRIRADANKPKQFSDVEIRLGETNEINVDLDPLEGANQVVRVEAELNTESQAARLTQRKESAAARDIISRDEISKAGGGSTASAAKRVVGVTLVGGRFIFVRGLGHRYVNTFFDGARVPSPEPDLRTVPLDIFPTSVLSGINVQKTYSADVPADFAGGSVQLESREVPEELFLNFKVWAGGNTETTFRSGLTSRGFAADAFGFGNIPRALPDIIPRDQPASGTDRVTFQDLYTPEQKEAFGEAMLLETEVGRNLIMPDFGVSGTVGHGFTYGKEGKFGFLASLGYANQWQTVRFDTFKQFSVSSGELVELPQVDYQGSETKNRVNLNGLGLVKWDINDDHRLSGLVFYSREASNEARRLDGRARNIANPPILNTRLRYIMRSILMTRLGGQHEFPEANGVKIDWFGSWAQARRDDPAIREMYFQDNSGPDSPPAWEYVIGEGRGGTQLFLDLLDNTESGQLNVTLPFTQWKGLNGKAKAGVWVEGKQREFTERRFAFGPYRGSLPPPPGTGNLLNEDTIGGGPPYPDGVDTDGGSFLLTEPGGARPTGSYRANQEIYSGYLLLDLPFVRWFRVVGGARFEASDIEVSPFDPFERGDEMLDDFLAESNARLEDRDWLPSLSFIFSPTEKQNVRLTGSRTLARPEFRELSPFAFTDYVGGAQVAGNQSLTSTRIWNVDLRWEWFPSANEVIAASVFYKYFNEPIERVVQPGTSNQFISFTNADSANNVGAELEVRKNLQFIWKKLDDLSIGANFTYVFSRVDLGDICDPEVEMCSEEELLDASTSRVRPLQDQSPFVVNAYISYDNDKIGTNGRIIYNVEGRRIATVGALGLPDIYYEPRHDLHFVFAQRVLKREKHELEVKLRVQNMLNSPDVWTQADRNTLRYRQGAEFRIGLEYEF